LKTQKVKSTIEKYLDSYYSNLESKKSSVSKKRTLYKRKDDKIPIISIEGNTMFVSPYIVEQLSSAFTIKEKESLELFSEWVNFKYSLGNLKSHLLVKESKCACKADVSRKLV